MATEKQVKMLQHWEVRAGLSKSPEGLLQALTNDQVSALREQLKQRSDERYHEDPTSATTLRPAGTKRPATAVQLKELSYLYNELGREWDEERWAAASYSFVKTEIAKLQPHVKPRPVQVDMMHLLGMHAKSAKPKYPASQKQQDYLSTLLVQLGYTVDRKVLTQLRRLTGQSASQLIDQAVRVKEREQEIKDWESSS